MSLRQMLLFSSVFQDETVEMEPSSYGSRAYGKLFDNVRNKATRMMHEEDGRAGLYCTADRVPYAAAEARAWDSRET